MKKMLVCPICNSNEIDLDTGGYTGKYRCRKCGYIGSFILEMTEGEYREMLEEKKLEKDEEKTKRI
ncbi:MAG: TFIIB-type zinc ribbon-containing protein [Archaeoglobaceae archaeon]